MNNTPKVWPDYLMIRDTALHDDLGGLGQRIYTTAGSGYEKMKYVRADLATRTASPASKPSGADPAIEVGATFNRRLDAVRVEDYEKAIAEFRSYGNVDDADALIGRAIAIARQRGGSDGSA